MARKGWHEFTPGSTRLGRGCMSHEPPQWQPITMLPKLAHHIDGMLQEAETQQGNLRQAQSKPWVLDNFTMSRVISVYTTQQNDLALFDEPPDALA